MDIEQQKTELKAFYSEMTKITRARHPFEIRHFIVGHHENRWRQWYQLCIETDAKWAAIEEAEFNRKITELEIQELNLKIESLLAGIVKRGERAAGLYETQIDEVAIEKLRVEVARKRRHLERGASLMVGALKEISDMTTIARNEFKDFFGKTEEELAKTHERDYWKDRLSRQLAVDLITFGKIQAGNLEVLLQLPEAKREEIMKAAIPRVEAQLQLAVKVENQLKVAHKVKEIGHGKSH
jgi:hypothetical protein